MLFTPSGTVIRERTEVHWPPEFMRMLAIFAANHQDTGLGIICESCHEALTGANAREDNFWRMECACRTYIGRNPIKDKFRKTN